MGQGKDRCRNTDKGNSSYPSRSQLLLRLVIQAL